MKLSKYIHQLIMDNETVIIPGFGAFISIYKPAVITENEITPPSKEISFTTQIRNNDGLLVTSVARDNRISKEKALKWIEKELHNILFQLDKGETVSFENTGSLKYNKENQIQFTPLFNSNLLLDSFGFEKISSIDTEEIAVEPETTPVSESAVEAEEAKIDDLKDNVHDIQTGADTPKEKESVQFTLPVFSQLQTKKETENKRKTAWYWYLLILIPVIIGGYLAVKKNLNTKPGDGFTNKHSKTVQNEISVAKTVPADPVVNDSLIQTKTDSISNLKTGSAVQITTGNYYLVGGSFKNEENVEKFILQLKEKGIEGQRLGKRGNLFLVGIESYDTEAEAIKSLNEHFKVDPGRNLWIYNK